MNDKLFRVEGKICIITGGFGQIGKNFVQAMRERGAKVAVWGRTVSDERIVKTFGEAALKDENLRFYKVDIQNKDEANAALDDMEKVWGDAPDVLVNNAGIDTQPSAPPEVSGPFENFPEEVFRDVVNVNLVGTFLTCQAVGARMVKANKGGSIINIGSIVGLTPLRLQCAFTAAKAGVFNLTKAMAMELAPENIRVNGIAPGSIMFEGTRALFYSDKARSEGILSHIPQHRAGDPDDIAYMTCFLADEKVSGYMTGSIVTIDGGWICGYTRDF